MPRRTPDKDERLCPSGPRKRDAEREELAVLTRVQRDRAPPVARDVFLTAVLYGDRTERAVGPSGAGG